jgi:hypothetical protein
MSMAIPDTLRYTKIPLNNGSGAIPAVGFGTLIPDPVATQDATRTALEVGFGTSIARSDTAMKTRLATRCRRRSGRERLGEKTSSSPPSYGTPIIGPSGQARL